MICHSSYQKEEMVKNEEKIVRRNVVIICYFSGWMHP